MILPLARIVNTVRQNRDLHVNGIQSGKKSTELAE
jgi:hypothetical protein